MSSISRLKLAAVSYNGSALEVRSAVYCEFGIGEQISIGRNSGNDLVLEDSSRVVSRIQANIAARSDSSASVENVSASTSVFINAHEVLPGKSGILNCTDALMIGAYVLKLERVASHQPAFPLPINSGAPAPADSVFIPEDIDFFAVDDLQASAPAPLNDNSLVAHFGESDLSLIQDSGDSTDNLFDHLLKENVAEHGALLATGNNTNTLIPEGDGVGLRQDPLASLLSHIAEQSVVTPDADRALEVESLFVVPRPKNVIDAVQDESRAVSSVLKSKQTSENPGAAQIIDADCRQAFARALQLDAHKLPAFTPAFFEQLGGVLLHLTAGTVNMMHERAQIKHGMRADVTIIAASGNNPLKFAPDAQSAIVHLLGEPMPGFMSAKDAIDDAADDLLAHQIGLMSGARAAVYEVVKNFSPEKIQKYLSAKNIIDSLLPMSKKAKLWGLYETHYAEVAGNAREEFELRFQQAFAQAYEQEIDKMCEARESV